MPMIYWCLDLEEQGKSFIVQHKHTLFHKYSKLCFTGVYYHKNRLNYGKDSVSFSRVAGSDEQLKNWIVF